MMTLRYYCILRSQGSIKKSQCLRVSGIHEPGTILPGKDDTRFLAVGGNPIAERPNISALP